MSIFTKRRDLIYKQTMTSASQKNLKAIVDPELLDEVTGLVEYPSALLGKYSEDFLNIPPEALISSMQIHQKCFPVQNDKNELMPYFVTVSNIESINPQQVIIGNELVINARLSDAAFFYETDLKTPLEQHLESLKHVVYQKKLGSLYDKTQRISKLALTVANTINADPAHTERAAQLCKTDLCTEMVGEFPELQGIIGSYYARHQGEDEEVALALKDYYLPRFSGDDLPNSPVACALALADRLDTLVGIFAIKQAPTGDKDPFALRRSALGIIRIIIEKELDINLLELIKNAAENLETDLIDRELCKEVHRFILERLRTWYQEQNFSADTLAAVLARQNQEFFDLHRRMQAVKAFRNLPEAQSLAAANKRVSNILIKEAPANNDLDFSDQLLQDEAEQALAKALKAKRDKVIPLYSNKEYTQALSELASLRDPIDRFFDEVMVMVDDDALRKNRLALLQRLRSIFLKVADISLLQEK